MKRPGERSVSPRSEPVVAIATDQPWSTSPSTTPPGSASSARKASSKNTSAKPSSPSSRPKPRTVTPGRVERDEQVAQALVPLRRRVGAEQPEQVRAERAARRPRLLPVEHPAAVDAPRLAAHGGQVAAGVRLRPALAPQVLGRRHAREDVVLLLGGAELEHGRGQQEDAVLRDPLRSAGPVVLLLEQQPLPQRRVAPAVGRRPRHGRPPVGEQPPLPAQVLREPLPRVARPRRPAALGAPRLEVAREPPPRLLPERAPPRPTSSDPPQTPTSVQPQAPPSGRSGCTDVVTRAP